MEKFQKHDRVTCKVPSDHAMAPEINGRIATVVALSAFGNDKMLVLHFQHIKDTFVAVMQEHVKKV